MNLSASELLFILKHGISLSSIFDATGLRKKDYVDVMREGGFPFACGTSPCRAGGHRLRTRAGHCIQCDTSKIAYMLRWQSSGYVYIAYSESLSLTKIGFSLDFDERIRSLNSSMYGGVSDWSLIKHYYFEDDAGVAENLVHRELAEWRAELSCFSGSSLVSCREVYNCDHADVVCVCDNLFY